MGPDATAARSVAVLGAGSWGTALAALIARHRPDELILTGQIHDHAARLRSFEIAAEALRALEPAAA